MFNCEREEGLTQFTVRVPASQLAEVSAGVCGRGSNLSSHTTIIFPVS